MIKEQNTLSEKFKRIMEIAKSAAIKSSFKYQVGAVILKHGRVISIGFNINKTHPLARKHFKWGTVHAEVAAVIGCRYNREVLKDSDIFVFRFNRMGKPAMAKPCAQCTMLLNEFNVRRAFWTVEENCWGMARVRDMVKDINKSVCYERNCREERKNERVHH